MNAIRAAAVLAALAAATPALAQYNPYIGANTVWSDVGAQTIAEVQRRLKAEGYYMGAINGLFDNNTQSALLDFQTDRKLNLTGHMDQATLAQLGFPPDTQQAQVPDATATPPAGLE